MHPPIACTREHKQKLCDEKQVVLEKKDLEKKGGGGRGHKNTYSRDRQNKKKSQFLRVFLDFQYVLHNTESWEHVKWGHTLKVTT